MLGTGRNPTGSLPSGDFPPNHDSIPLAISLAQGPSCKLYLRITAKPGLCSPAGWTLAGSLTMRSAFSYTGLDVWDMRLRTIRYSAAEVLSS